VRKYNDFIETAFQKGQIPEAAFSFKIADDDGSLFIGGSDSSLYTGAFEYHRVIRGVGWRIPRTQVRVGSTPVVENFVAEIDR
jgi:cathepsin D